MVRVIVWLIVFLIVVRLLWRFVHAVMEGAGFGRRQSASSSVKLVRDPVCGTYVVPTKALTAGYGPATQYFCSETCLRAWQDR